MNYEIMLRKSGQFYNCPVFMKNFTITYLRQKRITIIQKIAKYRRTYVARFSHRTIQTMREIQLSLHRWTKDMDQLITFLSVYLAQDLF